MANPDPSPKGNKRKSSVSLIAAAVPSYSALVLDIEGTLCPISFVHETLFPYVGKELRPYIDAHWNDESFKPVLEALRKQYKDDVASGDSKLKEAPAIPDEDGEDDAARDAVEKNVRWQMSWDRKSQALKMLQGEMWKEGYEKGELKGFVYPDVPPLFKSLQGMTPIYIYSSGSVLGQKLLFQYSNYGNLLPFIKGHYDTAIGSKLEKESYEKIEKDIGASGKLLFVSDNVKELEAAHAAGLMVALTVRPGNAPVDLPYKIGDFVVPHIESCDALLDDPFVDTPAEKRIRVETIPPGEVGDEDEEADDLASDAVSLAVVSARATVGDDDGLTTRSLEDEGSKEDGNSVKEA